MGTVIRAPFNFHNVFVDPRTQIVQENRYLLHPKPDIEEKINKLVAGIRERIHFKNIQILIRKMYSAPEGFIKGNMKFRICF